MRKGVLCIMGSGETAPTMVKVHRELLDRASSISKSFVMIDTPFGFQGNADDIAARTVEYFRTSLSVFVDIASLRSYSRSSSFDRELFMSKLRGASYVFSGPGSPTYALEQWKEINLRAILSELLEGTGIITFSSAAALSLGTYSVPVYEIYKVGTTPHFESGLGLLTELGLKAAVIPHYNNQEGGNHDTRFCYLGEERLSLLETEMDDDAFVFGVDEHTAAIFNLTDGVIRVVGIGGVTLRRRGISQFFANGSTLTIDEIVQFCHEGPGTEIFSGGTKAPPEISGSESTSDSLPTVRSQKPISPFLGIIKELGERFDIAIAEGNSKEATSSILDLEQEIYKWTSDTAQSNEIDLAREKLRGMIGALGEISKAGFQSSHGVIAPLIEALLDLRRGAREANDFAKADEIRDLLLSSSVEVRDSPQGTTWLIGSLDN